MHLRNGEHGYGVVTKALHWLTVLAVAGQLVLGYTMDPGAAVARAESALDARADACEAQAAGESAEERCEEAVERREERLEAGGYDVVDGTITALDLHVVLGLTVLLLAVTRVGWRRIGGLPPWSERLGASQRRWLGLSEKALLLTLVAMPSTGLALVWSGDDDLVPVHVATHVLLYAAVALHLAIVLGRGLLPRMLPGR